MLFLAAPAYGQLVGHASCYHTETFERLAWVSVSLMEGNFERRSATRKAEVLKLGENLITYSTITGPETITGMRLRCHFEFTGKDVASTDIEVTVNWTKPVEIPAGFTFPPKIILNLVQTPTGRRAFIGKAP